MRLHDYHLLAVARQTRSSIKAPGVIDVRWVAGVGTGRKTGGMKFVLDVESPQHIGRIIIKCKDPSVEGNLNAR
jgi:hypothetical protein